MQVKTIKSSAVFFEYFAYIFRPFVSNDTYASLISSETLSFFDYPTNKYISKSTTENQEKSKEHV